MTILKHSMQKQGWFPWLAHGMMSQGYYDGTITWTTPSSHLHYYFIPSNYKKRGRKALAACHISNRSVTEYIDALYKHLVCCADVQE